MAEKKIAIYVRVSSGKQADNHKMTMPRGPGLVPAEMFAEFGRALPAFEKKPLN